MSNILYKVGLMIALFASCTLSVGAQEVAGWTDDSGLEPAPLQDSLRLALPPLTYRGTISHYPYWGSYFTGFSDWALHHGLNASLSASAIVGVGRHSGGGFANSVSLMYADSITSHLSFAIGGYYSFLNYSGQQLRDAGLTAMLGYRFNDHWEASAFIQKSIMQPNLPPQLYWMNDVGDKIGASLRYNFNPSFSVSISVWDERRPYGPMPPRFSRTH